MTTDEVARGEGWQVRVDFSEASSAGGAVLVQQAQASPPDEARALAAAVAAAATRIDGGPPPARSGHDAIATNVEGVSHGLLVAVLIKLGGSIELDETDLAGDAMGDPEGRLYGVELQPLNAPRVRLAVVNHQSTTQP
jgi:hypothetical protein